MLAVKPKREYAIDNKQGANDLILKIVTARKEA